MNSTEATAPSSSVRKGKNRADRIEEMVGVFNHSYTVWAALVLVLLVAAWLRFNGLNWDQDQHQHADERFVSITTNALQWPSNLDTYFDPAVSTLSPYTLPNMEFFVYGTLPIYVVKWAAVTFNWNNYDQITQLGRKLSGLFDLGAVFVLFLIGRQLYGQKVGLLAAALLALSVLNIQLSHFFAMDTFANLFIIATFYFLIRASVNGRWLDYALAGLMFGLGLSSKLSVLTLVVPILVGAGVDLVHRSRKGDIVTAVEQLAIRLVTLFVIAALTFRVAQPVAFSGPGFWNWSLYQPWLDDIVEQQRIVSGLVDVPWLQQWTGRSIMFPLYNIVVWGLGLPLGLASLAGLGLATFELVKLRRIEHLLPVVYVLVTFIYHAATFIKFMRYFLPLYPFLALFAAYLIAWLWRRASAPEQSPSEPLQANRPGRWPGRVLSRVRFGPEMAAAVATLVLGGTLLYAQGFSTIYDREQTRIAASRWMYRELPQGSTLAVEHWDDWLPLGGLDGYAPYGDNGMFQLVEMRNYEADTPDKLNQMVANLTEADYIVLSSNRLYDSIPRLPMRYPMTSRYYRLLFSGRLGFERVAEFTSYPTILGIQIPDQVAEESFSVFDHPRVQIFKKTASFDPAMVRQELGQDIEWDSIVHMMPLQASAASKTLELSVAPFTRWLILAVMILVGLASAFFAWKRHSKSWRRSSDGDSDQPAS